MKVGVGKVKGGVGMVKAGVEKVKVMCGGEVRGSRRL